VSASIRKTKTGSGATAVQVVRYERRRVVVLKHIGSGHRADEVAALVDGARQWIWRSTLQQPLFVTETRRSLALATTRYIGISHAFAYAVLQGSAKQCGLDTLEDELLLDLAYMRLVEPSSKLRAMELLERYFTRRYSQRSVYRALPKLNRHKETLETLAMTYAKNVLGASMELVLYDVTTLYFESFKADELRIPGFSKDGKSQQPQIVLGLLVTNTGFPLGYEVFAGNTFEGKTILPVLRAFMARVDTKDLVVVADAAMLSEKVLNEIRQAGMSYIVGARLANSSPTLIHRISQELGQLDNAIVRVPSKHGDMVCAFSAKRFKKDQTTMQQQLTKAQALVARKSSL